MNLNGTETIISYVLASKLMVFLASNFLTGATFLLVQKFYEERSRWFSSVWPSVFICSIINGFLAVIISTSIDGYHIVMPCVVTTMVLTVEMMIFFKDSSIKSYIALGLCIAIHVVVQYDVGAAVMQIWHSSEPIAFELGSITHGVLLYVFCCISSGIIFAIVRFSSVFPVDEFKVFIHNWKRGALLLSVVTFGTILLLLTHALLVPQSKVIHNTDFENVLYINTALKSVFILFICYSIILVSTYMERQSVEAVALKDKLDEESAFRKSSQRNVLFYYQVNTNTGVMTDNNNFFRHDFIPKTYAHGEFMALVKHMIFEGDLSIVHKISNFDFISPDIEESHMLNERLRMSVHGLLSLIDFSNPMNQKIKDRLLLYDKEYIWTEISTVARRDKNTGDTIVYITLSDVDDKVEMETKLIQAAHTDVLTGLLNRNAAEDIIKERILKKEVGVLFMIDLDEFKSINDNLGHPKGDEVLVETAGILREFFRGEDVVSRLGGDEFMVYAVGLLEKSIIDDRANKLNEKLTREYAIPDSDKKIKVSGSIGIARFPMDAESFKQLYEKSDIALYHSKENGRCQHTFYSNL